MKNLLWIILLLPILFSACKKDQATTSLAVLTTTAPSSITSNSAQAGGNVTSNGGSTISQAGICWALHTNPTVGDSLVPSNVKTGIFVSSLANLGANTTYHVRAYAINGAGTAYGGEDSFTTAKGAPVLTTSAIINNAALIAQSGGSITNDGGAPVTDRGVCWSTSPNPTITDSKVSGGSGTGLFSDTLTNLTPNVTYYVRAYATNSYSTGYGNQVSFTVSTTGTVTDIDGNVYGTITIGTQTWTTTNLRVAHYRNGDPIINGFTSMNLDTVSPYTPGAYTYPNGDSSNNQVYGKLYTIGTAHDPRNLAPVGWHVPTDQDWYTLEYYEGLTAADVKVNPSDVGDRGTIGGKFLQGGSSGLNLQLAGCYCPNCGGYLGFGGPGGFGMYLTSSLFSTTAYSILRDFNLSYPNSGPITRDESYLPASVRLVKD